MSTDVLMADTGDEEEAELVEWLANDGASVAAGQPVAQVETGKALIEIEAPAGGTLRHVEPVGAVVTTGAVIARITDDGR